MVAGVRAGEDRRVVGERDRRQRRHRAVPERGAHLDQAGDVRRLAARGHVVEHVGVRAVEEEADDVTADARPGRGRRSRTAPSWTGEVRGRRRGARSRAARRSSGATSTRRAARGDDAVGARTPLPAITNGARRLHEPERAVLAAVAALVLPVVGGRVDDAEVGRGRRVEELRDLVEGEGVGVGRAGAGAGGRCSSASGVNWSVDWSASGSAPSAVSTDLAVGARPSPSPAGTRPAPSGGQRLVASSRRVSTMSTIGSSSGVEEDSSAASAVGPIARRRPGGRASVGRSRPMAVGHRAAEQSRIRDGHDALPVVTSGSARRYSCLSVRRRFGAPGLARSALAAFLVSRTSHARSIPRKKLLCARSRPDPPTSPAQWHVIDAEGAVLGRLATEVATLLRGKHKPIWAPHVDTGDHVIIVNASKLASRRARAAGQAVPPALRLPGRRPHREPRAPARPRPREGRAARGEAHAAEGPARRAAC